MCKHLTLLLGTLFLYTSTASGASLCSRLPDLAKQSPRYFDTPSLAGLKADYLLVDKTRHLLYLFNQGIVLKTYRIALGRGGLGQKRRSGDNLTPEGQYFIEYKNSASDYHLALRISYPSQDDINYARKHGFDPGGDIMLHGLPNNPISRAFTNHPYRDWTRGCVAVNDEQIEEIWGLVVTGTPIELCK